MNLVKPMWWNTENWLYRFSLCTINPLKPVDKVSYDESHDPSKRSYLFVTQDSLTSFVDKLVVPPSSDSVSAAIVSPETHISPYLRIMINVSRGMGVTPENQPTKREVVKNLRVEARDWRHDPPISDVLFETMATLIREPSSQKGKGNKSRRDPSA